MRKQHFFLIILFTLFFLFYPGDSFFIKIFGFNRALFARENKLIKYQLHHLPYVINKYLIPEISAQGVYIADLDSFTPIFEKNHQSKYLPASTTKIITALVAFKNFKLDDILTVKRVVAEPQTMGLVVGEKISFANLLYGLLVHSANDAALTLADNFPGGEKNFVEKMNEKAAHLFMKNSAFKNPAGFDEFGQYITPYNLALAARELLNNKTLARIVAIKNITISDADFKYFHQLTNVNKLLGEIPGIGGLKTGYTEDAGENLISFYKKNDHRFVIVILKSEDRFLDTQKTIEWINNNVDFIQYILP